MLDQVTSNVRPARPGELAGLAALVSAAFETFRGAVPDGLLDRYVAISADLGQHANHGEIVVLESDGVPAGTVTYYPDASAEGLGLPAGWAGFRTLAVRPDARGRGFGRQLVDHCIDRARLQGAGTVGLHTADFMKDAVAIYRRFGFVRRPTFDLQASDVLGVSDPAGDVLVTAYGLAL